jgi:hypothetical protein
LQELLLAAGAVGDHHHAPSYRGCRGLAVIATDYLYT